MLDLDSNAALIDSTIITIKANAAFSGYKFLARSFNLDTIVFDTVTDLNRVVYYQLDPVPNLPTVNFTLVGYYE